MCDCNAPIDRLYAASRAAMAKAFPAHAAAIEKGAYHRIDELYACDALGEKGLHNLPHRMADEKLTEMLDEHLETLFDDLSQSMHDFYAKKLASAKS
jgi:hypothetical protein